VVHLVEPRVWRQMNDKVTIDNSPDPDVVRAAGGIIWTPSGAGRLVALVHRPKYDDWSLPKGKLEEGESWEEAAVREALEETGCEVKVTGFAGTVSYVVKGRPKLVVYWNMEKTGDCLFQRSREIDRLAWLSQNDAMSRLDHIGERRLLNENLRP